MRFILVRIVIETSGHYEDQSTVDFSLISASLSLPAAPQLSQRLYFFPDDPPPPNRRRHTNNTQVAALVVIMVSADTIFLVSGYYIPGIWIRYSQQAVAAILKIKLNQIKLKFRCIICYCHGWNAAPFSNEGV